MNIYEDFRAYLKRHFIYTKNAREPATFRDIVDHYERHGDCSEQILGVIIEEYNKGEAVFLKAKGVDQWTTGYANIQRKYERLFFLLK